MKVAFFQLFGRLTQKRKKHEALSQKQPEQEQANPALPEWKYRREDETLILSGQGDLPDYLIFEPALDNEIRREIKHVIVCEGITGIGNYAFSAFSDLLYVQLPDSLKRIGSSAFDKCKSLEKIVIPADITQIGASAFRGCTNLKEILFKGSIAQIG